MTEMDVAVPVHPVRRLLNKVPTFNRWFALAAAAIMMLAGGTTYVFATISLSMKVRMEYLQYQISFIGTMSAAGNIMGILPALFHDFMGPRPTALLSGVVMAFGYGLVYMALQKWFYTSFWMVGCFYLVFSAGESACFTSAMATSIKNFNPKHRGKVSGVLSCIYGISSAIFSFIYQHVFHQELLGFVFFVTVFVGVVPIVCGIFLNVVPKDFDRSRRENLVQQQIEEEQRYILEKEEGTDVKHIGTVNEPDEEQEEPVVEEDIIPPKQDDSVSPLVMIRSIDFYLFAFIVFACMGSGQTIVNHIGTAVESYGGNKNSISSIMIVNSIASCLGRVLFGFTSDRLSAYVIRPAFLNYALLMMSVSAYGFAFTNPGILVYFLTFGVGFSYGGVNAIIIAYLADRFGPKFLGMNNTISKLGALIGNFLLSTALAGAIYQANTRGGGNICRGRECYQSTFLIVASICLAGFVCSLVLMHRNQGMYAKIREKTAMENSAKMFKTVKV
ncbi:hypothetical protein AKO1_014054 [Acrasis kona]|uniref:Nodulin-like domain-containing protein n=1 Tax=Acrasis kona TaxID=1008807 RepID=A0AAW2Z591_9EUKA